jgi:anthranilate synthase component 1
MSTLRAVTKELLADADTPVSAYLKLCAHQDNAFLFESGEGMDNVGRYSIVAWDPLAELRLEAGRVVLDVGGITDEHPADEFFGIAAKTQDDLNCANLPDLPFVGALSGYVGYEAVKLMERLPDGQAHNLPVSRLVYPSRFVVFDHLARMMTLVAIADDEQTGLAKLEESERLLGAALPLRAKPGQVTVEPPPKERFVQAVKKAKEYILAGDIFQVVLSGQFAGKAEVDPLSVYRWLRVKSPSPYMFYLRFPDCHLVGSSPETLVKMENGLLQLRPIAGTSGRSRDPQRDMELEREMLASEKERAEHLMLVDLARNDAGRVCRYGSVKVEPFMSVERFSHVMHIVSAVSGLLESELSVWEAFQAAFPAGTVSGAPKVRAMEIISELEDAPRGPYAGAVGSFGPGPRMDTCIAIRMIQFEGGRFTLQAGAGIVADSDPEMEYEEITQKAAQGLAALRAAAEGLS